MPEVLIADADRRAVPARLLGVLGCGACVVSLLLFAALQYFMPRYASPMGLNYAGAVHFGRMVLGGPPGPLDYESFATRFRFLLYLAWTGYAVALGAGLAGWQIGTRGAGMLVGTLGLVLTFLCPASLSTDVYAYVAYGRVRAVYGENPYEVGPRSLAKRGDPTADFVGYLELPCVYGPVWTQLSIAQAMALRHRDLWWQVVAMKLTAATALVAAAWAGRAVAERRRPGWGNLALLAIGLNPLLLIEGPGNGHNDLSMMAMVLGAAALYQRGRLGTGDLALGVAIGIKFLPVLVLPWLVLERCRGQGPRGVMRRATLTILLTLAPTILAYATLWRGAATFAPLQSRASWGVDHGEADRRLLEQLGLPAPAIPATAWAFRQLPVPTMYLGLSAWLWSAPRRLRWADAWALLTAALVAWTMTVRYPWYMSWPLMAALTRWDRPGIGVSAACLAYSHLLLLQYIDVS